MEILYCFKDLVIFVWYTRASDSRVMISWGSYLLANASKKTILTFRKSNATSYRFPFSVNLTKDSWKASPSKCGMPSSDLLAASLPHMTTFSKWNILMSPDLSKSRFDCWYWSPLLESIMLWSLRLRSKKLIKPERTGTERTQLCLFAPCFVHRFLPPLAYTRLGKMTAAGYIYYSKLL